MISCTSIAHIDMVEILFSREKVPLNVSKNKLFRKIAVTLAEYGSCLLQVMGFWSERGLGFGEPDGTSPSRIPTSTFPREV